MKRILPRVLVAMFLVVMAPLVRAVPIPVSTTTGTGLLINFDFTGQTPAPPYASMNFSLDFSGQTVGETIFVDRYTDLDGMAFFTTTTLGGPGTTSFSSTTSLSGFTDGLFSLVLRIAAGDVELTSFTATGTDAAGAAVTINGATVPEPGTLALLGLGLAGLAATRRRRQPSAT